MHRERSHSFYEKEPENIDLLGLINSTESKVITGIACMIAIGYDIAGFDGALLFGSTIALAGLLIRPAQYETIRKTTEEVAELLMTSKPMAYLYDCLHAPPPPVITKNGNETQMTFCVRVKKQL